MDNAEENKTPKSVNFIPGVCPKCGAQLEVDPSREAAVCEYCGTPFIVDKAARNARSENADNETSDNENAEKKSSLETVIGFIEREWDKSREEHREEKKMQNEYSMEFLRNSWKYFLVLFGVLIVVWVIANALGFFN